MPTARELLEQADALMRRNREIAIDDIPVLTDAVPLAGEGLPLPRTPHAPAPAAPAVSPSLAEPAAAGVATPGERAAPGGPHEPPDSMLQDGGEPSDWLEFEGGEPSVIGEAPDSVAIVPPVEHVRASEEALLLAAEHEEIELTTPAEDAFDDEFAPRESPREVAPEPPEYVRDADAPVAPWTAAPERVRAPEPEPTPEELPAPAVAATPEPTPEPAPAPAAAPEREPTPELASEAAAEAPTVPATEGEPAPASFVLPPLPAWQPEVATIAMPVAVTPPTAPVIVEYAGLAPASVAADFVAPVPAEPSGAAAATVAPAHPVIAEPEPAAVAPAAIVADDQAKWDAIAEEVRVQVLQRIDLFTDTGLRDQLGLRLQPIVDRASADLVATISINVGELLRAYVAEAIEREIESWRRNH